MARSRFGRTAPKGDGFLGRDDGIVGLKETALVVNRWKTEDKASRCLRLGREETERMWQRGRDCRTEGGRAGACHALLRYSPATKVLVTMRKRTLQLCPDRSRRRPGHPGVSQQEGLLGAQHAVTKPRRPRWAFADRAPTPPRLPASSGFRLGGPVDGEEPTPPQTGHSVPRPLRPVQGHPRDLSQPGRLRAGADEDAAASAAAANGLRT